MSKKKRIWYPGATYHVMSRGNRRTVLFKDTSDYVRFLECIALSKERYGFKIHSLCLMTNHFHIAVETAQEELWKIMQKILHPYSIGQIDIHSDWQYNICTIKFYSKNYGWKRHFESTIL